MSNQTKIEREIAAIMFTDIVGYTKLTTEDEEKAFQLVNNLKSTWNILRLATMIRWAPYESEDDAIESALNITDRAIEKAVNENNKTDMETIADELEMSMELDDRADEVKKIINKMI